MLFITVAYGASGLSLNLLSVVSIALAFPFLRLATSRCSCQVYRMIIG